MLLRKVCQLMRAILWIPMFCLAACGSLGSWSRSSEMTPSLVPVATVASSSTPTVTGVPSPTPTATLGPSEYKCTITFHPGSIHFDGSGVPPGSVICLNSGDYRGIVFEDLHGTVGSPITIRNRIGRVRVVGSSLALRNCRHVNLTGAGTPGVEYGIYADETYVSIYDGIEGIGVDHIEVSDQRLGVNEPYDPNHEMTDIHIHHNYLHASLGGYDSTLMYIGHARYDRNPGDYVARRVEIDHNLFDGADGQALKIASIVEDCSIHHNQINDVVRIPSRELQSAAINIGHGCSAHVYNNVIKGSGGYGILGSDGFFGSLIYNNLLVDTGQGVGDYEDAFITWGHGYRVFNNTIIGARRFGIAFRANEYDNAAYNNIILGTGSDSIWWVNSPRANFHHNLTKEGGYTVASFGFVDPANGDYRLTRSSPAIDAGATPSFPLHADLDDSPRPVGEYDVGAFEFAPPLARAPLRK